MSIQHCSVCGKPFEPQISTTTPFCSERCRHVDLGRWMNEEYGLPVERAEQPDELPTGDESNS